MPQPPLSLYVHLPWCVRKCPYCDFNSHSAGEDPPLDRYIDALLTDLEREALRADRRPLESVFLGGGTPSLFSPGQVGRLLDATDRLLGLPEGVEVTMEANPGAVEHGAFAGYRAAGVNRISLGAQSFDENLLRKLGRVHGSAETDSAFLQARAAGFERINLDLMFALPGQDVDMALSDLDRAIGLQPDHISWYQLTLEPNTVFFSRPPTDLPGEELAWEIQEAGQARLVDAGFEQYETSAFARPNQRARHNLNYWQFGDYLAVGAGAHGKITDAAGHIWRYEKARHPLSYIKGMETDAQPVTPVRVGEEDAVFEFMLNALRLVEGFSAGQFESRTGLPIGLVGDRLDKARARGLLEASGRGSWRPTDLGKRFLNDLQGLFLP
jgi:oxygen-independent coproporphyrinogen-3 oxidase